MLQLIGFLAIVLFFLAPLGIVLSLINPNWAIFWMKRRTKAKAIGLYSGLTILSWLLIIILLALLQPTTSPQAVKIQITQADFGDKWPFTVNEGELNCIPVSKDGSIGAVIFSTNGVTYAINGTATAQGKFKDVSEIWRDNPAFPGLKVDISPMINKGLEICQQKSQ